MPFRRFGYLSELKIARGSSSERRSYLKFEVTGLSGPPAEARLRLYVTDGSDDGGSVYRVSNAYQGGGSPWREFALTWLNAPTISGSPLSTLGAIGAGSWAEYPVTAAMIGNGIYSFGITTTSSDEAVFRSRQYATHPPELWIQP